MARALGIAALVLALTLAGCQGAGRGGGGTAADPGPAAAAAAAVPDGATPKPTPDEALIALLRAEQTGDHAASYRLLSAQGRDGLDEATWARRRSELPAVTAFEVDPPEGASVTATVEHEAGLDPFLGLRPGRERQTWQARPVAGGWLLDANPSVTPQYPPDEQAGDAAIAWARAVQACDEEGARGHQGVDVLYGRPEAAGALCGAPGTLVAGPTGPAPPGPETADLVGQFGPETLVWARRVALSGGPAPFSVVLAPIGSVWKVVAVLG